MYAHNKRFAAVIAVAMFCLPCVATAAEQLPKWYIAVEAANLDLGSGDVQRTRYTNNCTPLGCNRDTNVTEVDTDVEEINDWRFGLGYQFSDTVRSELFYTSYSQTIEPSGSYGSAGLDIKLLTLSLWQDFNYEWAGITPYFGGSLLLGDMTLGSADGRFVGVQLGLGASYRLMDRLDLDMGYRHVMSEPDIELEGGSYDSERNEYVLDYRGSAWTLGVRYMLF